MRIGYPCINRSIGCSSARSFRLASYSDTRLRETVAANLTCLRSILSWNAAHGLLFFRITSDLIPFASHPVCTFPWQEHFAGDFRAIGDMIRRHNFRISMHPDQFVLLNTPNKEILERSIADLTFQVQILDLMGLNADAKVQIHVGGIYHDKLSSLERFICNYAILDENILHRLVIENDERLYTAADCLSVHKQTGIPVLLDIFHHSVHNTTGESVCDLLQYIGNTWKKEDGIPMVDYSSQHPGKRPGAHAECIDHRDFCQFLIDTGASDLDIILEIKDKEKSALAALAIAGNDPRLVTGLS